jgi:hypothetical protein
MISPDCGSPSAAKAAQEPILCGAAEAAPFQTSSGAKQRPSSFLQTVERNKSRALSKQTTNQNLSPEQFCHYLLVREWYA